MRDALKKAIREAVPVPSHIREAAVACATDLRSGPQYACMPDSGLWSDFSEDDWGPIPGDLEGKVEGVYAGAVGNMLREFIQDMPGELFADEDEEFISAQEPQGEDVDGEWMEPGPYRVICSKSILSALFGDTISREFH